MRKRSAAVRFIEKIRIDLGSGCWIWTASVRSSDGYGSFAVSHGHTVQAHRFAYELLVGPVPDGLALDHRCRNRLCVNPEHLEPVTWQENTLRGESIMAARAKQTHCKRGHSLSGSNVWLKKSGSRECRACWAVHRERRRSRRLAGLA